ncbi:hypothetical protein [Spirosoma endophyticum]|uniref:Uncharacterized protein n=1 Tax=Spirosoma endophyticum TaxID=662367 RepID=A0A1I1WF47_9BACT|nr:hypothetical protein [Spirosoma endophyticum]SFD92023.1 hypothetical protein SAMN05216167_108198 [Spirosoma endophyticum]
MLETEALLLGATILLFGLTYLNYVRFTRIHRQLQRQRKQADHYLCETQKRYFESIAYNQKALKARNDAYKEAEQIASFWSAERLN